MLVLLLAPLCRVGTSRFFVNAFFVDRFNFRCGDLQHVTNGKMHCCTCFVRFALQAWLLSSHAESIRLTKREDRPGAHVHYLSSVEGCEPRAYLALARQFTLLIECTLQVLKVLLCFSTAFSGTPNDLKADDATHMLLRTFLDVLVLCRRFCRLGRSVQSTVCNERTARSAPRFRSLMIPQPHLAVLLLLWRRKDCSRPKKGETPAHAAERRLLAVSSLQALALDYDLGDHEILKESILLEVRCDVEHAYVRNTVRRALRFQLLDGGFRCRGRYIFLRRLYTPQ